MRIITPIVIANMKNVEIKKWDHSTFCELCDRHSLKFSEKLDFTTYFKAVMNASINFTIHHFSSKIL